MPEEKPAEVKVRFYENFHQVESGHGVSFGFLGTYIDIEEFQHRLIQVRVTADGGTYKIGVVSDVYVLPEDEEETRFTSSLAWNASGASIAAALNAISAIALGGKFEWTFVEDGLLGPVLDVKAALFGSEQRLPDGFDNEEDLFGHLVWAWDETFYVINLEKGGCGSPDHKGEINPDGAQQGRRDLDRPITGNRA